MNKPIMTMLITILTSEGEVCTRIEEGVKLACETCPIEKSCPVSKVKNDDS